MKISSELTRVADRITIAPWEDDPFAADVRVVVEKVDLETGKPCRRVHIRVGGWKTDIENARLWADAILKAIDIAETQP